jgi:hypothetical protein
MTLAWKRKVFYRREWETGQWQCIGKVNCRMK